MSQPLLVIFKSLTYKKQIEYFDLVHIQNMKIQTYNFIFPWGVVISVFFALGVWYSVAMKSLHSQPNLASGLVCPCCVPLAHCEIWKWFVATMSVTCTCVQGIERQFKMWSCIAWHLQMNRWMFMSIGTAMHAIHRPTLS